MCHKRPIQQRNKTIQTKQKRQLLKMTTFNNVLTIVSSDESYRYFIRTHMLSKHDVSWTASDNWNNTAWSTCNNVKEIWLSHVTGRLDSVICKYARVNLKKPVKSMPRSYVTKKRIYSTYFYDEIYFLKKKKKKKKSVCTLYIRIKVKL